MRAFDYPGMVSVVEAGTFGEAQASNPSDLLYLVPGVEFLGGPRRTGQVPVVRGFTGPDVQVRVDGARQDFLTGHLGRFFIDPDMVKTAEVVRGPVSSLYGSGALGGVISFSTIDPLDLLGPEGTVAVRSRIGGQSVNDELLLSQAAALNLGQGLRALGYLSRRTSGDIELGGDGELLAKDDIVNGLAKLTYDGENGVWGSLTYSRFANDAEEPRNPQSDLNTVPGSASTRSSSATWSPRTPSPSSAGGRPTILSSTSR